MRLPFPEHVPLKHALIFTGVLVSLQLLEGTAVYFSLGCAVFILIATIAFNLGGGLTRTAGVYVFFYSMLVVIVGISYKALLGEPGHTHLEDPFTDIEVYLAGITGMLGAVIISGRFRRKQGLLQNILREQQMFRSSIGCIVVGSIGASAIALLGPSAAALESAFAQLNYLVPLGIIIGTMYEIRHSGGRRSANMFMIVGGAYSVITGGIIGFSKQGLFTAPLCWLLPVCVMRYRLSARQFILTGAALFYAFYFLVPLDQYGRGEIHQDTTQSERMALVETMLTHPVRTRQLYLAYFKNMEENGIFYGGYYDKAQGFMDRLEFVSVDDTLVAFTQRENRTVGLGPVLESFANTVPRFIWHDKPAPHFGGNFYVHEMGGLSDDDTTTGISFSPTAEAFHMNKWIGVLLVAPILWLMTFLVFDILFGDLRATPWGLLVIVSLSHTASEGALGGLVHFLTFGAEILVFCALFAVYVAPVFAIPILGPEHRKVGRPGFREELIRPPVVDDQA